jgi:hypothetical protein
MAIFKSVLVILVIAFTIAALGLFHVPIVKNTETTSNVPQTTVSPAESSAPKPAESAPVGAGPLPVDQLADCQYGRPLTDLQGNQTFAAMTVTHVYAHPMDSGPIPNNECGTYTLVGADPKTFLALDQFYGKDANGVWFIADPSEEGSPKSYQIFGADPATFALIPDSFFPRNSLEEGFSEFYTKDKHHVYWLGQVVVGADPATFAINDPYGGTSCQFYDAHDGTRLYYKGTQFTPPTVWTNGCP